MRDLAAIWGQTGPATLLNRSENEIWAAGDLVIRLHREGYHSRAEIASELDWLMALQATGLRCVTPRRAVSGELIVEVGARLAVAFTRIDGHHPQAGDDLAAWLPEIGQIAARLHDHAKAWARPKGFIRKVWDAPAMIGAGAIWGDWRAAIGLDEAGRELLEATAADLAARLASYRGGFGLIHGDLRLGNLLVTPQGLAVLDFDDCGMGWLMSDFAATVSFIETDPRLPDYARLWVEGYRALRPLGAEDLAILPVMVMMRRIQLTAWLTSRAGNDTWAEFGGPQFARETVGLARDYLGGAGWWGAR
ncbi:MAG: phosphotransferase [Paracoccus sp. (in: a-proteobacteria)]|nr:phosphotransferase [Paracoccus sp. (in: a-proteobacteria)]